MRPPAFPAAPKEHSQQYLDVFIRILTQYLLTIATTKAEYNGRYDQNFRASNYFIGEADMGWYTGTGTPEGAVTAPIGSLFTRSDGGASTTLYVKESGVGNTGWVAK